MKTFQEFTKQPEQLNEISLDDYKNIYKDHLIKLFNILDDAIKEAETTYKYAMNGNNEKIIKEIISEIKKLQDKLNIN